MSSPKIVFSFDFDKLFELIGENDWGLTYGVAEN